MAEAWRSWRPWLWLTVGLAAALAPLAGTAAWLSAGLWLAQPLLAIACSGLRGSRSLSIEPASLLRQALGLAGLWGLAYLALALVVAWPLEALRESGALMPALAVSLTAGLVLLGLWRLWPVFGLAERENASRTELFASAGTGGQHDAGRGLAVATAVFAVLALGLALVWPELLPPAWRLAALLAQAVLALAAHAAIQHWGRSPRREKRPESRLPIIGAETADAPTDAIVVESGSATQRLYAALREGRVHAALSALSEGADPKSLPEPGDRDQRSLPMLAALLGDLRLLRELIARGVDLNQAHGGLTPLLAATRDSWHGRPEAVMTLLANGADSRQADAEGNTPLHYAARSTDPAVAALLLDAGAQVDALNREGVSPLGMACAAGNWRLAKFLIEHGAKPEPTGGQPALLAAAGGEDDPAGVQLLLRHKARVDARGADQRTALMQACAAGNVEIIGALLEAGADRNSHDAYGLRPLLEVAQSQQPAALARLGQARPDPHVDDADGRNALVLAVLAAAPQELLRHLLALGVDPEQRDHQGLRALEHALAAGRWPLVAVLDPSYPLPSSVADSVHQHGFERSPRELLREALLADRGDSAQAMMRLGAGPDAAGLAALLLEFALDNDLPRMDWLLAHGASAEARIASGETVLFHLLDRGGQTAAGLLRLLERSASPAGNGGLARYLSACAKHEHNTRGYEQLALALLERGADAFGVDGAQTPPLASAIRLGWLRLAEALLAAGVDPNGRDGHDHTPLHIAALLGRESALRLLIRHGGDPALRTPDGQTPLGTALANGREDLSHWLEWRVWQLPGRSLQSADLTAAASSGDAEAVWRLIELGLPIDALDGQGCSALLRAAGGGHAAAVKLLLARGADHRLAARTGATALSAAISMRQAEVVDLLLAADADPDQPLPGDVTPLMLAAALGLPEIIARLLVHGADASCRDAQGLGSLHCAALHAFSSRDRQRVLALFDILILADVPVDQANASGQTPLLLMLGARAEPGTACDEDVLLAVLERLLGEGVDIDTQDKRGYSALHLAALHGLLRVVQRLLREGADRTRRDALGRTPHDLALLRGYVDVATEFEPTRASPSLARFLRDPRA